MGSELRFLLLGDLEVRRDGAVVPMTSSRLKALLATLVLNAGQSVSVDTIIERLWGPDASGSARGTVQVYAMRLRRVLGADVISTRSTGYAIDVAADQVDVSIFRDLMARARRADDPATEWQLLSEAMALWRGPALSDVPSDSLQRDMVPRLTEERLLAIARRAEIGIELGGPGRHVAELTELTRQYPLRERLWGLLILALSQSGRRGEALAAYQDVRRSLADELGIDPSDELQRLHQDILTGGDPTPPAGLPPRPEVRPAQLPPDVPGFVGRTWAIEEVTGHLTGGAPVLVTGPPGIGKTALALHVAHLVRPGYADGQLYVDLRGYSPAPPLPETVVLARFLRALGVPDNQIPSDLDDQTNLYRSLLADRRLLVVLDNASGPSQVRRLLPGEPGCAVLITSRDALRGLVALNGGRQVSLGPLCAEESHAVLVGILGPERIAMQPDALAALAEQCAQLPLALRIAAANLQDNPHQPIKVYVDELVARGRVAQLRVPGDEGAAVKAAFDLSYDRLAPDAARLFRRFSLAPGSDVTIPAAAALLDCSDDLAAQVLDTLAAANLVVPTGLGRYQMHDLLLAYAAARAAQDDGADSAETRLLDFYLHTADAAGRLLYPDALRAPWPLPEPTARPLTFDTEGAALAWLDTERTTLGAAAERAIDRGLTHYGWRMADATYAYFAARGHAVEALVICEAALADVRASGEQQVETYVLDFMGMIHFRTSKYDLAERYHTEGLRIGRRIGDVRAQIGCLRHLGRVTSQLGQPDRTIGYHQEALDLAERQADLDEQAINITYIGLAHQSAGRIDQATVWHQRAWDLARRTGNQSTLSAVRGGLGLAAWSRGELAEAIDHQRASIAAAAAAGDRHLQGGGLICLAEALCAAGDYDQAIAEAQAAVDLETGERRYQVGAAEIITTARMLRGERIGIIEDYERELRQAREIKFKYGEISILISLATAYRITGQPTAALRHAEQAMAAMRDTGIRQLRHRAEIELELCQSLNHAAVPDPTSTN